MRKTHLMITAGLGAVAVFAGVRLSLINTEWSTPQWVFTVVLPSTALIFQAAGGLALWSWLDKARNHNRYRARHAWQARHWLAAATRQTSPMMGEPEAMAVRIR